MFGVKLRFCLDAVSSYKKCNYRCLWPNWSIFSSSSSSHFFLLLPSRLLLLPSLHFFFFFSSTGDLNPGLVHARQALCYWAISPDFWTFYFSPPLICACMLYVCVCICSCCESHCVYPPLGVWRSENSPRCQGSPSTLFKSHYLFRQGYCPCNSPVSVSHFTVGELGLQTLLCLAFTWVLGNLNSCSWTWTANALPTPLSLSHLYFLFLR